jgi:large subunit ribosomal protein L29
MSGEEIRKLSVEELRGKIQEARKELFNLRFSHAVGQLEKKTRLRVARKNITRMLTVMTELGGSE